MKPPSSGAVREQDKRAHCLVKETSAQRLSSPRREIGPDRAAASAEKVVERTQLSERGKRLDPSGWKVGGTDTSWEGA